MKALIKFLYLSQLWLLLYGLSSYLVLAYAAQPDADQRQTVLVGLYHFPPFIEARGTELGGLAIDMLTLMNQEQDKYYFQPIRTLPNTRIDMFRKGRYDLSLFEDIKWGWQNENVDVSEPYLDGGEVYITKAIAGRDESYFDDFEHKTMIGIKGYHYAFADFNDNEVFLKQKFNMHLTTSNTRSVSMLLSGEHGDIAVVSKSFLAKYLRENPQQRQQLLISKKMDQPYLHTIIVRRGIKPSVSEINAILQRLKDNGKLALLWESLSVDSIYLPQ